MNLSVIIPFYNEKDLIGRAIDSVLMNSAFVDKLEVFVCNDGLLSESEIRSHVGAQGNLAIRVLPNKYAQGPGGARNTGLDESTCDQIAFLDADDFWLPGKIEAQFRAVKRGATFVATSYRFDNDYTLVEPPMRIVSPVDVFLRRGIGTSTVLLTRELLGHIRFKDIRYSQDIDYWFALANSPYFRYVGVTEEFVVYNTNGSTKNKFLQFQYLNKVLSINKVNWITRVQVLTSYTVTGVYNHYLSRLLA